MLSTLQMCQLVPTTTKKTILDLKYCVKIISVLFQFLHNSSSKGEIIILLFGKQNLIYFVDHLCQLCHIRLSKTAAPPIQMGIFQPKHNLSAQLLKIYISKYIIGQSTCFYMLKWMTVPQHRKTIL